MISTSLHLHFHLKEFTEELPCLPFVNGIQSDIYANAVLRRLMLLT